jgi:hypothetical protein
VPPGSIRPAEAARWTPHDLDWGPLYEPHRHPLGAMIGGRLPLRPGAYVLSIEAEALSATAPPAELTVQPARHAPAITDGVFVRQDGAMTVGFVVPDGAVEATLRLRGGGPLVIRSLRLRPGG